MLKSVSLRVLLTLAILAAVPSLVRSQTLTTELTADGLDYPVFVTAAPGDNSRLFVLEQRGRIRIVKNGVLETRPFLDLTDSVGCCGEEGLLGLAFHPDYQTNGKFYLNYIVPVPSTPGKTRVAEFQVSSDPDSADRSTQVVLFELPQPFPNHNSGMLAFGPNDGYLYASLGDGGGGGDTENRAQNPTMLYGKMLRLDVDNPDAGMNYGIPDDNPFVNAGDTLPEIWAIGLRNPWRWSFDRATGDMYIGDVGQSSREEVDYQPAASTGGENYGWRCYEGTQTYNLSGDCSGPFVEPFTEYVTHDLGRLAITGGYVYRGCAIPDLAGTYFYADYGSGEIWSLRYDGATVTDSTSRTAELGLGSISIPSFGEDAQGELYIIEYNAVPNGRIYKIIPTGEPAPCGGGCCLNRVGDANGLGGDEPSIGDVSAMIDALFIANGPGPIACLAEADVNQSGGVNPGFADISIGDISILIDYLFITGSTLGLPACL